MTTYVDLTLNLIRNLKTEEDLSYLYHYLCFLATNPMLPPEEKETITTFLQETLASPGFIFDENYYIQNPSAQLIMQPIDEEDEANYNLAVEAENMSDALLRAIMSLTLSVPASNHAGMLVSLRRRLTALYDRGIVGLHLELLCMGFNLPIIQEEQEGLEEEIADMDDQKRYNTRGDIFSLIEAAFLDIMTLNRPNLLSNQSDSGLNNMAILEATLLTPYKEFDFSQNNSLDLEALADLDNPNLDEFFNVTLPYSMAFQGIGWKEFAEHYARVYEFCAELEKTRSGKALDLKFKNLTLAVETTEFLPSTCVKFAWTYSLLTRLMPVWEDRGLLDQAKAAMNEYLQEHGQRTRVLGEPYPSTVDNFSLDYQGAFNQMFVMNNLRNNGPRRGSIGRNISSLHAAMVYSSIQPPSTSDLQTFTSDDEVMDFLLGYYEPAIRVLNSVTTKYLDEMRQARNRAANRRGGIAAARMTAGLPRAAMNPRVRRGADQMYVAANPFNLED